MPLNLSGDVQIEGDTLAFEQHKCLHGVPTDSLHQPSDLHFQEEKYEAGSPYCLNISKLAAWSNGY